MFTYKKCNSNKNCYSPANAIVRIFPDYANCYVLSKKSKEKKIPKIVWTRVGIENQAFRAFMHCIYHNS